MDSHLTPYRLIHIDISLAGFVCGPTEICKITTGRSPGVHNEVIVNKSPFRRVERGIKCRQTLSPTELPPSTHRGLATRT